MRTESGFEVHGEQLSYTYLVGDSNVRVWSWYDSIACLRQPEAPVR